MIPLQQWICDTCRELIEKPRNGWVEWLSDEDFKVHGFRICHNRHGCFLYDKTPGKRDSHLEDLLGPRGLIALLAEVHIGPIHDPQGTSPSTIKDPASWAEIFRRLHVPHYEEARRYFQDAKEDDYYGGVNEIWPYVEEHLLWVIKEYSSKDQD